MKNNHSRSGTAELMRGKAAADAVDGAGVVASGAVTEAVATGREANGASRAERQRARILDAAERCFIERGFHAASMAHIAATADMSAGLIYRYFAGKNAIVQAIIQRHVQTNACTAMHRLNSSKDFCDVVLEVFERWRRRDDPSMNAALFLELTAEAARDPEIAQIVQSKDQLISDELTAAVQRAAREQGVELTAAAASSRGVLLQCVLEGLACRAVRDPTLRAKTLRPLLSKVITALLS
jgi:AcrR family transcriptional regulator